MQSVKFVQKTGKFYADGVLIGLAYSGNGDGLNNPELDSLRDVGPIPVGKYIGNRIVCPEKGPTVWTLVPDGGNDMKGRSGFMLHWDNRAHNFTASEGCIVPLMADTFVRINQEFLLEVVADE